MNRSLLTVVLLVAALASAGCAHDPVACVAPGCATPAPVVTLAKLRAEVKALGRKNVPGPTAALYAPRIVDAEPYAGVVVQRDIAYGPAERNRLDVFAPASAAGRPMPVLVFVHGGGFAAGNKRLSPASPFYDNVMLWAVRHGMVGVNMTYRLAPGDPWPAGPEDVGRAIGWVHDHVASLGGDPHRVFLMGHSAGAAHVAAYVSHEGFHRVPGSGLAGALMLSGLYRITPELVATGPTYPGYFGKDPSKHEEESSLRGLVASRVPLWVGNAELDPPFIEEQGKFLLDALCAAGKCPARAWFAHHSHMSEAYSIGSDDPSVGDAVYAFIQTRVQ